MTLYYVLVFVLLILETLSFVVLILPFPRKWRRRALTWIKESNWVSQTEWTFKFAFAFVGLLFLDACNRIYATQESHDNSLSDAITEASHAAKRFYNQRNMYLTGFTLFLTLILNRTYTLVLDLLKVEDELDTIKKERGTNLSNETGKDLKNENERLKKLLEQQNVECLSLTDKVNKYEKIIAKENKKSV